MFFPPRRKHPFLPIEIVILRLLSERPYHGYEIKKRIEELTGGAWKPSFSMIYPPLQKMLRRGLIRRKVTQKGKKTLYLYELTEKGKQKLREITEDFMDRVSIMLEEAKENPHRALPLLIFTSRLGKLLLEMFPPEEQKEILLTLQEALKAILNKIEKLLEER